MTDKDTERLTRELYSELVSLPPMDLKMAEVIRDKLVIAYEELEDDRGYVETFISMMGREISQCKKEQIDLVKGKPLQD